jgi:pSer/pThr/pTyr-binding forkhead associated (FHA) protein
MGAVFQLAIEPASGGRYEHRLAAGNYILGREEGCDIPIRSPEVSRRHARLTLGADRCAIEDLGSSSGTFIEGVSGRERLKATSRLSLEGRRPITEAHLQIARSSVAANTVLACGCNSRQWRINLWTTNE